MNKIKKAIHEKNITQCEAARLVGMRVCNFNLWVNGYILLPKKYHKKVTKLLGIKL